MAVSNISRERRRRRLLSRRAWPVCGRGEKRSLSQNFCSESSFGFPHSILFTGPKQNFESLCMHASIQNLASCPAKSLLVQVKLHDNLQSPRRDLRVDSGSKIQIERYSLQEDSERETDKRSDFGGVAPCTACDTQTLPSWAMPMYRRISDIILHTRTYQEYTYVYVRTYDTRNVLRLCAHFYSPHKAETIKRISRFKCMPMALSLFVRHLSDTIFMDGYNFLINLF